MSTRVVAAVDLGASSGRVVAGILDRGTVTLDVVHRFPNAVVEVDGHLRWDLTGLYEEVLTGLASLASKYPQVESIGIDTWGVDYGLLGPGGALLAQPVAYRDERTAKIIDDVHAVVSPDEIFATNGLQFLPFNTIYQLAAERRGPLWSQAEHVVLLPDLLAFWLTGALRTEYTNATTTGLVDVQTGRWSADLLARLGVPASLLPEVEQPGTVRGNVGADLCVRLGLPASTVVTTVGSHDTASAVVGVPALTPSFAYVSSGMWSLVGVELASPVVTAAARAANFTNEGGVDGRTRFLRNVGGLWLLHECVRTWETEGWEHDLAELLDDAAALPAGGAVVDVGDEGFIAPGDMPSRIAAAVAESGGIPPVEPAATVRCILDSLAAAYARTVAEAADLAGHGVDVIHVVGGGSQNDLLCRLTATAAELPVVAGPVEATALGNVLVQARTIGAAPVSLERLRAVVARSSTLRRYNPS